MFIKLWLTKINSLLEPKVKCNSKKFSKEIGFSGKNNNFPALTTTKNFILSKMS